MSISPSAFQGEWVYTSIPLTAAAIGGGGVHHTHGADATSHNSFPCATVWSLSEAIEPQEGAPRVSNIARHLACCAEMLRNLFDVHVEDHLDAWKVVM